MNTLFICRASTREGMGHLLRTSHVASVAAQYVPVKVAMLGMESLSAKLRRNLSNAIFVQNEKDLISLSDDWNTDCVFFDLLSVKEENFSALRKNRLAVSISPVFTHLDKVDLIFHRSTAYPDEWGTFPEAVELFCGLQYAVIDQRVCRIDTRQYRQTLKAQKLPVAISMGGTDAANKTCILLRRLKDIQIPMFFWVLLGEGYAHSYEELVSSVADSRHEIVLVKSNESMWQVLQHCALMILAGGVTTYEAARAALPTINLLEQGNHAFLLQELADKGALRYYCNSMEKLADTALLELYSLDADREKLLQIHKNAKACGLDGNGSERIIKQTLCRFAKQSWGKVCQV